jgi:lipid-A-disaccharide synthase
MHYVAPQVWAWKKGRAKTMYKYIDHLLTLFPNEPAYFTPYHLRADFVGHPAIESSMVTADANAFITKYNIPKDKRIVLVLPGSRHNEVANLLPIFLETVKELKKNNPDLYFVLPTVKTVEKRVRDMVKENKADILIINTQEDRYAAAKGASAAIAASGTVSLELAIIDVPHLVAYKVPALTAFLARHFTNIKYVNLTNLLLDMPIVPELLQQDCNKEKLINVTNDLLNSQSKLYQEEKEAFKELREVLGLGKVRPSQKAARIIIKRIEENHKSEKLV